MIETWANKSDPNYKRKLDNVQEKYARVKKDVFTDERKIEQRKQGFTKARTKLKKNLLGEFAD